MSHPTGLGVEVVGGGFELIQSLSKARDAELKLSNLGVFLLEFGLEPVWIGGWSLWNGCVNT